MLRSVMSALVLAAFSIVQPATARASGIEMIQFLEEIEGQWGGSGLLHVTNEFGSRIETPYDQDTGVRYLARDQWQVTNRRRLQGGWLQDNLFTFAVRGDSLYIGSPVPNEPAEVVESTPISLVYRLLRADPRTGRVYRYTYDMRLGPSVRGRAALLGRSVIDWNGTPISDDAFHLDR